MPDRRYAVMGLALFFLAITYPAWRAFAVGTRAWEPALAKASASPCVLPPAEMRATHMKLLAAWRDMAVRRGVRRTMAAGGKTVTVSLSGTCLGCHEKAKFCDRCHDFAAVKPDCWNCHVVPPPGAEAPGDTAGLKTRPTVSGGVS